MSTALPPLAAIRVFEAVARHLSFTRAAAELGMTQAAVSYQIKLLEERFGGPLFLRKPRQIELSAAGQRLAPAITDAFALMAEAYAAARGGIEGVLTVCAKVSFATSWLARHIGAFQLAHPALAVRIDATDRAIDFTREETDLAIFFGTGDWPGLQAHRLLAGDYTPMLSRDLVARLGPHYTPADLLRIPLLDPGDYWWREWFKAAGVNYEMPKLVYNLSSQAVINAAAKAGQGAAILSTALYDDDLAAGRLIQPFDLVMPSDRAFHLVYPETRRNQPKIRAFRDWILAELASG
ncbi:LysR family transcriptional regulator [Labrys sp. LIt4]|uniref:LysR family transcriptional regulator n=1 Tax=Labrys okinawensis TaxID=346911 RepID=A0A2S9Q899_9HYPH|nr:LysR substrate-binding domain-containing protein [Labrys okinawensis]MBP0581777.1 LysR family transcriptional regulator [Labrys sp. LIt4]PRH85577.1 LysR family transcriptional regulator [Labrys okinawensis]